MRSRHHHFSAVTIDTRLAVLVTRIAGLFVCPGLDAVAEAEIGRMHLSIQILALVAMQALLIAVTPLAIILTREFDHPMACAPSGFVVSRLKVFALGVAVIAIIGLVQIIMAFGAGRHLGQMMSPDLFFVLDALMATAAGGFR